MEKEKKIKVGLRVRESVYKRMQKLALKDRRSLNQIGEIATERYLDLRKA